jgi:hypothetical protein
VVNFSGFFAKLKISRGFLCKSLILKEAAMERGKGPKWHSPIGSLPFHRAQKTREFQGPTPSNFPT